MNRRPILRAVRSTSEQVQRSLDSVISELDQLVTEGKEAEKPESSGSMRFFWATDTSMLYLDVGGGWVKVGGKVSSADLVTPLNLTIGEG